MKNLFLTFLCLQGLSATAQTPYPTGIQNCIARFDFSTTAISGTRLIDVSGNTHNGDIFNTTSVAGWRSGPNTAMKFDGYSSYIQVGHTSLLSPQTITMIGLVRYDGFWNGPCQGNVVIEKGYPWKNSGTYSLFASDQEYDQDCDSFSPLLETTGADLGHVSYTPATIPPPLQMGKWYFVAASYNGSTVSIYQQRMDSTSGMPTNITPIYTAPTQGAIGSNNMDVLIGRTLNPPHPYWFNGAMDEVAVFNRGLSNDEIFSIYKYLWGQPLGVSAAEVPENNVLAYTENGVLYLRSTDGQIIGDVSIYNVAGQKLSSQKFDLSFTSIDASSYPREILFIRIVRNGAALMLKASNL